MATFKSLQAGSASHLRMTGQVAGAISGGLTVASVIVRMVHDLVRDAIADVIGKVASKVAIGVLTAGLAAPWAVASVIADVSSWVTRLSKEVADVVLSARNLKGLLDKASKLLDDVGAAFGRITSSIGEAAAKAGDGVAGAARQVGDFLSSLRPQQALAGAPGMTTRQAREVTKASPTVYRPKGPKTTKPSRSNPNEGRWGQKRKETPTESASGAGKSEVDPKNDRTDRGDRRDARGRFTERNGGANTYADYERQGREVYSQQREEAGKPLQRMVEEQRKAHVDGVEQGRFYDGLAQEADGTWTGIENKHGSASLKAEQREFDRAVSSDNPARVRLDTGEVI
ncbi:hypothetical protein [Actinomyces viscosus]|uniref:Uncharacterized protein n=1 Tax=Actinomyces viscosus TaxID=1656 RepID=A0A3S4VXE4_ACTVI|nr:hypothetical protein [Actinomyces viscosus]VEI16398.1 Uncharacterised protein [Actinomyces viscosus]